MTSRTAACAGRHLLRTARICPTGGAVGSFCSPAAKPMQPLPLPQTPDLLARLPVQGNGPMLDMDQVATIAVINNPDLKSARFKAGVADAQAFEAGILPNPQLNAELLFPTNQEPPAWEKKVRIRAWFHLRT